MKEGGRQSSHASPTFEIYFFQGITSPTRHGKYLPGQFQAAVTESGTGGHLCLLNLSRN